MLDCSHRYTLYFSKFGCLCLSIFVRRTTSIHRNWADIFHDHHMSPFSSNIVQTAPAFHHKHCPISWTSAVKLSWMFHFTENAAMPPKAEATYVAYQLHCCNSSTCLLSLLQWHVPVLRVYHALSIVHAEASQHGIREPKKKKLSTQG
jgi:hypothetical protein